MRQYQIPEWFRDAKFGIWAHWGPQSAAEDGDWYARNMYMEGGKQYQYHLEHYGHPSKVGFKDVIATWKADRFDPEHLMDLYKKAGAKYFVSMAVHHDNFDLWNSKYQPRWNAVASGPKKNVVEMFRQAARKRGLRFGVSEHLSNSYNWFATSHRSDKQGPLAGVPYDGNDPKFADLYHDIPADKVWTAEAMSRDAPDSWKRQWFNRIKDLVDQHEPDLLYTDGGISFEEYGLGLVANLYNKSARLHGGNVEGVYTSKRRDDSTEGTCVLDLERGIVDEIWPTPWQTDTCIGSWHYKKGIEYKTPKIVIDMLADIVSRNGNLLLNFPLPNSGELDPQERSVLAAITEWMSVNSEAIYSSRPWKTYGEGPSTVKASAPASERHQGAPPPGAFRPSRQAFNERGRQPLTAEDVRFTTKGNALYAFVMGWPAKQAVIAALGTKSAQGVGKIENVELLGHSGKLKWSQEATGLKVDMPAEKPCEHAVTLKITGA